MDYPIRFCANNIPTNLVSFSYYIHLTIGGVDSFFLADQNSAVNPKNKVFFEYSEDSSFVSDCVYV